MRHLADPRSRIASLGADGRVVGLQRERSASTNLTGWTAVDGPPYGRSIKLAMAPLEKTFNVRCIIALGMARSTSREELAAKAHAGDWREDRPSRLQFGSRA